MAIINKSAYESKASSLFIGFVTLFFAISLTACGGGGGGDSTSNTPPSINNLSFSPEGAYLNDGGGSITINGTIDFFDPDGDITSYVLTIRDSSNNIIATLSDPIPGISGITSGTLLLSTLVNTTIVEVYSFSVYLDDSSGNVSNTLSGNMPVIGPSSVSSVLPDTGVDKCYNHSAIINCPLSDADAFYGQDYQYETNPIDLTNNGDGTVTDSLTGLMWQRDDDGTDYNWFAATGTYDLTNNPTTIDVCGDLTLAGYTDWRLPARRELLSIVDYGTANPAIDTNHFPGTSVVSYWTDTERLSSAWNIEFAEGNINQDSKTNVFRVRCVRGSSWGSSNYVDNGNGTVSDTQTGLTWQYDRQVIISGGWEAMLAYCEALELAGHTDWRLPDIKELDSIVDATTELGGVSNSQCSSTTVATEYDNNWRVSFDQASVDYGMVFNFPVSGKSSCTYFRCVRSH
jgi:hypothetical protein